MSYTALYRKFRPSTFEDVKGQDHIVTTLKNQIRADRIGHAYLFCGTRGTGKTTIAKILARSVNCEHPVDGSPCNECPTCKAILAGVSTNVIEIDAASNNGVDNIREIREEVAYRPTQGRYKVYIIDEVHMLSTGAFNALLKTLEEPPSYVIFILATTEKHKIIPTILSRCQIYDFNRIRVEDSVEYLKYIASQEGISADEESLNLIAQKADGGMRDALSMFDKAVSFCGTALDYRNVAQTLNVLDYDTYFSVTEMLLAGNYVDVLVAFDSVLSKGFSGQTFMSGMNRHMRDLLMARQPDTLRLIEMTGTLLERYRTQAGACSVEFLFGAISVLTELDGKIRQSSNQRLLVELGLMKIAGLGQKKNDTLTSSGEYPLPELTPRTAAAAVAATPAAQPQPDPATRPGPNPVPAAPQQSAAVQPGQASQPASAPIPAPAPQPAAPRPETPAQSAAAPGPAPAPAARPEASKPAPQPVRRPLISGTSLSELLASAGSNPDEEPSEQETAEPEVATIDPECERKLERAREKILNLIRERRPRFVPAFELMRVQGNTISLSVPTSELREEILRSKTGMLMRIAELAGITGAIELEVVVNEEIRAARPIKLEDRVKYMTEKNPLIAELRKALDLEVE